MWEREKEEGEYQRITTETLRYRHQGTLLRSPATSHREVMLSGLVVLTVGFALYMLVSGREDRLTAS